MTISTNVTENFMLTARMVHQMGFDAGFVNVPAEPPSRILSHYEGMDRVNLVACYNAGHAKGGIRRYQQDHAQTVN